MARTWSRRCSGWPPRDPRIPCASSTTRRGCPTFTADLARGLVRLALDRRPGTFHLTNQGETTWFGFARATLHAAGLDPGMVEPISTADLDPPRPAPRPANSRLDNAALRLSGLPALPEWEDALGRLVAAVGPVPRGPRQGPRAEERIDVTPGRARTAGQAVHREQVGTAGGPAGGSPGGNGRRVAVIGVGYVGLPTAATLAHLGHQVTCGDADAAKIALLEGGRVPIVEDQLEELVREGIAAGRLRFVVGAAEAVEGAQFVFLCVPTPQGEDGSADLSYVEAVGREIAPHLEPGSVIVNKSTVPVGSTLVVERVLGRRDVAVVSNPEFLREGTAVTDSLHPERIVVGADDQSMAAKVAELFAGTHAPRLITDAATAETIKYASNAFLATKLSFVNAVAGLCEAVGADVRDVILGLGYDRRIGFEYLRPGPGWGGSCLPKDTRALVHIGEQAGYDFSFLRGAIATNDEQFARVVDKVRAGARHCRRSRGRADRGLGADLQGGHRRLAELPCDRGGPATGRRGGRRARLRPDGRGARRRGAERARRPGRNVAVGGRRAHLPRPLRRCPTGRRPSWCSPNGTNSDGWTSPASARRCVQLGRRRRDGTCSTPRSSAATASSTRGSVAGESPAVVLGGGGFLGSHLCDQLLARGDEVVAVDDFSTGRRANLAHLADHPGFTLVEADVSRSLPVEGPVTGVLDLASPASPPDYLWPAHSRPSRSAAKAPDSVSSSPTGTVSRFLLASTSEVYGDPEQHPQTEAYWGHVNPVGPRSVYDEAKRFAEALTMAHQRTLGTNVGIARIFNTYGPRLRPDDGRVVSNFLLQAMSGEPLTVYGDGSQTRSLCYVADEVRGLARALRLGPGRSRQHRQSGRVHGPPARGAPWSRFSVPPRRSCTCPLPADDPTRRRPDITLAKEALGWQPSTPLEEGLAETVAFLAEDAGLSARGPGALDCRRRRRPCWGDRRPGGTGRWRERHAMTVEDADLPAEDGLAREAPEYRLLSVIVPVFNERATVAEVIRRIRSVDLPLEREVVVVDDGSSDGTDKVLSALGDSTVRVLSHHSNAGKGAAIRTGMEAVRGDLVLIQDADLEYDPEDWPKLLDPVLRGKARVVYGSRFTGERKNMLPLHWIGNRFLSLVTNVLYSSTLSDMETCYKLFDRRVLEWDHGRVRPVRLRARDHRQDPAPGRADLRGADLLRGPRGRGG